MLPVALAATSLAIWIYLALGRGGFWRVSQLTLPDANSDSEKRIVAVIPARDEADGIGRAVQSLLAQSYEPPLQVILVDDSSSDGTADVAIEAAKGVGQSRRLSVVRGEPLANGWTGKLWALSQGIDQALAFHRDYLLFTDADIVHGANSIRNLAAIAGAGSYDLASFMVKLRCESFAEKALIPAFVFFFLQLSP